jgi:hypothetical protein
VVDPECRVLGTEGLRVVDASIMPEVPRANTNLTTIMIAEHIAARLRRQERGHTAPAAGVLCLLSYRCRQPILAKRRIAKTVVWEASTGSRAREEATAGGRIPGVCGCGG